MAHPANGVMITNTRTNQFGFSENIFSLILRSEATTTEKEIVQMIVWLIFCLNFQSDSNVQLILSLKSNQNQNIKSAIQ